jgi:hypothetical protein
LELNYQLNSLRNIKIFEAVIYNKKTIDKPTVIIILAIHNVNSKTDFRETNGRIIKVIL